MIAKFKVILKKARRIPRKVINWLGIDIFRYRAHFNYVPDLYGRSYNKKLDPRDNPGFAALADQVVRDKRSYLYYDRLYILYQAIQNVRHFSGHSLAEIGVFRGGGSFFIASVARQVFAVPPTMYSIDTFEGHPDNIHPTLDGWHLPGGFANTSFDQVKAYLSDFPNVQVHKGTFESRAVNLEQDRFCFVHLDVDIYYPTKAALEFFAPRMPAGGIIVVDDYGFTTCPGAKQAVDEFMQVQREFVFFHMDTGQAVLVRISANAPASKL